MSNTNKIKAMRIKVENFIVRKMINWSYKILARQCRSLGISAVDAQEIINNSRFCDIK